MRRWSHSCAHVALLVVLLVTGSGMAGAIATPTAVDAADVATDDVIELRQELRHTPNRPGEYDAHHRYRIPAGVIRFSVRLPAGTTILDTTGFDHDEGGTYTWDRSTTRPTLTYRVPANRTVDRDDPSGGPGRYSFVDVGEWGLVLRPQVAHEWGWIGAGQVRLDHELAVDGEGAAGEAIAFFGPHETYTHSAHGQTFRLVVPEAATLEEDPQDILQSIAHASDTLRVGDRDRAVFVVAAPSGDVEWGLNGLHTAGADVWVRDDEPLQSADNVWLHEYVHTRQDYAAADDLRWFTEGSAVYFAALLSLEQDLIDFEAFRGRLERGREARFDDVRLAEPGTWEGDPDYYVGALVAGELDRQLRLATGTERSLQDTLRRLNGASGTVDASQFEGLLRSDAGDAVAALGDRYTRTTAHPEPWDVADHVEAFGTPLPRIDTTVQPVYRVAGTYRNGTIAEPVELAPGETLSVDVRVANDGDRSGDYDVGFRVDGEEWDRRTGRLAPGESTALAFDHEFERVGERVVSIAETTVPVRVSPPARPTVTDLSADRTTVATGETVNLTVAVANDADRPGRLEIPVTLDGVEVAREDVRLGPGEARSVTVELTLTEPGEHVIRLGEADDRTVVVTASAPLWEELPGFDALAALLALCLLVIVGARRG